MSDVVRYRAVLLAVRDLAWSGSPGQAVVTDSLPFCCLLAAPDTSATYGLRAALGARSPIMMRIGVAHGPAGRGQTSRDAHACSEHQGRPAISPYSPPGGLYVDGHPLLHVHRVPCAPPGCTSVACGLLRPVSMPFEPSQITASS